MVQFSLAQLAKEEEARKRKPVKEEEKDYKKRIQAVVKGSEAAARQTKREMKEFDRQEKEREKVMKEEQKAMEEANKAEQEAKEKAESTKVYVNPDFAAKDKFKFEDSTKKQLGGFNPGAKLYSSQRTDVGSDDSLKITRNSPMGLVKPLQPNILDAAADERQKELAKQRAMAGHKWVLLHR